MKQVTRLVTKTEMQRNLTAARQLLGEKKFFNFTPAPTLNVHTGFISFNWSMKHSMLPGLILLKSRGSFLEARFDELLFSPVLLRALRKTLWVPIHVGDTLSVPEEELKSLIREDEHLEFDSFYPAARR